MKRARIIIADNHRNVVDVLENLLGLLGVDVYTCTTGKEVLDHLRSDDVDAVITDVEMPVMGGIDLARALKNERPRLPVIMMSSYAGDEMAEEAKQTGAVGLISKPFKLDAIADLLESVGVAIARPA